ncbi:hypothetical protein [Saccharophagus degradans]|uniref:Uncharacterized protein n=1 Tax=Saccharophagus degradans TaxID=86304 RepID=A0AAW7XBS6_9GAMM|nr:hypothetical protein [Saccharophagus degradans]MDO6424914.1 hypothetical protein [Saccharophagus degradans]MDO6609827.1 hypothetical protein [Saccharophagus degradans]
MIRDLNEDGIDDLSYEFTLDGYYEFVDANFDGVVDQTHKYDDKGVLISSKYDDDFDGVLETKVVYQFTVPYRTYVDTNKNGLIDLVFFYESGVLNHSEQLETGMS